MKKNNIFYKIKLLYWKIVPCRIRMWHWRQIPYGIENLWKFFYVVWNYRTWDFSFFLRVVILMLKMMEYNFKKYGHHVDSERDAQKMRIARLLLERVVADEYHEEVFKKHDEKWGTIELDDKPVVIDGQEMFEMILSRQNANTPELIEQERQEYRRIMNKPYEMRRRDLEYAFKIISKNLLCWWD